MIWQTALQRSGRSSVIGALTILSAAAPFDSSAVPSPLAGFDRLGFPRIVGGLTNITARKGDEVSWEVDAIGLEPLTFQWRFFGQDIPGATNAVLTLPEVEAGMAGLYEVMVSNRVGFTNSGNLTLIVLSPPIIIQPPQSASAALGDRAEFSVQAISEGPLSYQWRLNSVNLPGETSSNLVRTAATIADGGEYSVSVRSPGGTTISDGALLSLRLSLPRGFFLSDDFNARPETNSRVGQIKGTNTFYTIEPGEPLPAGKPGDKSAWLAWRAPSRGLVTFRTAGSSFDTLLAAYTGASLAELSQVDRDDDKGGFLTSRVTFKAVKGKQYSIAVAGSGSASGVIVLSWDFRPTQEDIAAVTLHPVSQTARAGDSAVMKAFVDFQDRSAFRFQWFLNGRLLPDFTFTNWTIKAMSVDTVGICQLFITNIFTGQVIASDPAAMEIGPGPSVSVDKFGELESEPGGLERAAVPPRKAGFTSVSAGTLGTQILDNFGATTEKGEPAHGGVTGGASRWFSLVPDTNGTMVVDTIGSAIDTVLAVYTGTDFSNLKQVASDDNSAPDGVRSMVRFKTKRGTIYQVAVDGKNGQQGNIHLNWKLGITPTIIEQPVSQETLSGTEIVFTAQAAGTPEPGLQWLFNGSPLLNATNGSLLLNRVQGAQAGIYQIKFANFAGSSISRSAILAVDPFGPSLTASGFSGPQFQLSLEADPAFEYILEGSVNLLDWSPVLTNGGTAALTLADPLATALAHRFYRVRVVP